MINNVGRRVYSVNSRGKVTTSFLEGFVGMHCSNKMATPSVNWVQIENTCAGPDMQFFQQQGQLSQRAVAGHWGPGMRLYVFPTCNVCVYASRVTRRVCVLYVRVYGCTCARRRY